MKKIKIIFFLIGIISIITAANLESNTQNDNVSISFFNKTAIAQTEGQLDCTYYCAFVNYNVCYYWTEFPGVVCVGNRVIYT